MIRRIRLPLAIALLLGALALALPWLARLRPDGRSLSEPTEFVVSRPGDGGPGSLREAVFAADRAPAHARIRVRPLRVVLITPLPPLVNPRGITIEGAEEGRVIDATAVEGAAAIDVSAPGCLLRGLTVVGAREQGVLARAPGLRIERCAFERSRVGVLAAPGASDLSIEDSRFAGNGIGVALPGAGQRAQIVRSSFERHEIAAVWQVAPAAAGGEGVAVRTSRFERDRFAAVLINVAARFESNEVALARDAALYLTGPGIQVRRNRLRGGARHGVSGVGTAGAVVEGNEIDHNRGVGILLQDARGTTVRDNRLHANGYGIALVFGEPAGPNVVAGNLVLGSEFDGVWMVGASPVVRANRVLGSRGAAIRVLDFEPLRGPLRESAPLLAGNVVAEDRLDESVRGVYRARDEEERR